MKWGLLAIRRTHFSRSFSKVIGIVFLLAISLAASAAPVIKIDQPWWNFGLITNLSSLSHDFWITNVGDAPLIINRVTSTCEACLQATLQKTNIPPGETAIIHARLDLRLLNGSVSRAILIGCNDPQQPSPVLELNGEVDPVYHVAPLAPLLDLADARMPLPWRSLLSFPSVRRCPVFFVTILTFKSALPPKPISAAF
jgi:hypothetical protein